MDISSWDQKDVGVWFDLIRRQSKGQAPMSAKEIREMDRIKHKYSLSKYYIFH